MNKVIIGTNWKMHKSIAEAKAYIAKLNEFFEGFSDDIELFIIPPFTALAPVKEILDASSILVGAQNMHWEDEGAYTGEISPVHLEELGIDLIELGHSERRQYYNENDYDLNKKVKAALNHNLRPLICIGELMEHKRNGITEEILSIQLKTILKEIEFQSAKDIIIAYEPRWAIGVSGVSPEPYYVQRIHQFIREKLIQLYPSIGYEIPILYGGSVNTENAISLLNLDHVNGLFIGRAAWNIDSFKEILFDVRELIREWKCEDER